MCEIMEEGRYATAMDYCSLPYHLADKKSAKCQDTLVILFTKFNTFKTDYL